MRVIRLVPVGLVCALLPAQHALQPLDDARCAVLLHQLQPATGAPWRSVPWHIDLLTAQHLAAKAKKPLFLWAMDGHPLGCT
jgi:hypothetical protein